MRSDRDDGCRARRRSDPPGTAAAAFARRPARACERRPARCAARHPNLSVEQITLEVENLKVDIALDARLANLLKLTAGATASIDKVKLDIKGVRAQATLIVRLDNVRAIIERTLQTLDNNPQIISGLYNTVDNTVGTVGGVANNAVGTVGGITSSLLRNGQVLDLARAGLTEVSRTVNGAGQTVRQVRNASGGLLEVVTDAAGRILSSRSIRP